MGRGVGRIRRKWEDITKMDFKERECEGVDLILLDQDRDRWLAPVNTVMNPRVSQESKILGRIMASGFQEGLLILEADFLKTGVEFSFFQSDLS
jgi:hypothetical protein